MTETENLTLEPHSLATQRSLTVHRFGTPGARPKVYIQAGLHADELAANLTAHHLAEKLNAAEVNGEIVLLPLANPLGLSQMVNRTHLGRSDLATGQNFNRGFTDVSPSLNVQELANIEDVRAAIGKALDAVKPRLEIEMLQHQLQTLAHDADIVLDLHTDSESELHLYLDPEHWPEAEDLAAWLGVPVVMLSRNSGGNPFEETIAAPYIAAGVEAPLTVVVELRGQPDVYDELAEKDAHGLFCFLQARGIVEGDPGPAPAFTGAAAKFEFTALLPAPVAGHIVYKTDLGTMVKKGGLIAEIVDVRGLMNARTPVYSPTSGRFFARLSNKLARPGISIGKIFGSEKIEKRGTYLLGD
jgi:predicted deacylase